MIRPRLSRTRAGDKTACAARSMSMPDSRLPQPAGTPRAYARVHPQPDIAIEHWDDLFSAVKARLRRVADGPVRSSVLECADALDQLQTTLRHELGRRQRAEIEALDVPAGRNGARAEDPRARQPAPQDGPTALPNGCSLRQRLDHELAARESRRDRVSVLLVDLDGVASIDEAHGRAIGDELRHAVAARLSRALRADDLVRHTAADEFGCLVTDLPGRAALAALACKLFDALSAPFQIGTLRLTVRPSIGTATGGAGTTDAEALLRNAGIAMALARRRHTGHAFFDGCDDARTHDSDAPSPAGS